MVWKYDPPKEKMVLTDEQCLRYPDWPDSWTLVYHDPELCLNYYERPGLRDDWSNDPEWGRRLKSHWKEKGSVTSQEQGAEALYGRGTGPFERGREDEDRNEQVPTERVCKHS